MSFDRAQTIASCLLHEELWLNLGDAA